MMNEKSEALRLADLLEERPHDALDFLPVKATAELRRLAKVEDEWAALSQDQGKLEGQIDRLVAQRDALLGALKRIVDWDAAGLALTEDHAAQALAAIKQAEGEHMTEQPTALRLADALEHDPLKWCDEAAAELRRLHELALEQQGKIYALEMARSMEQKTAKLKQDALLEALQELCDTLGECGMTEKARAAIKAVEGAKDPLAATRRAIVRAAAEIGKAMA